MTAGRSALAYDAFMGRWSRLVAHDFLAWLSVPPHSRWLDVGCGTGALASAILQSASPSEIWGIDPSEEYIAYARASLPQDRCHLLVADAQELPPNSQTLMPQSRAWRSIWSRNPMPLSPR